jgi:hypothetical protein
VKPTLAIALLALRTALRSRVILVLVALLLAAAFLLPLAIRHDGTPEGLIRLHLSYTLGIASFLLGLATLWAGCAAISQEADDKTLQLLLVKPVPRLQIWLGKWLALLLINAVLLAVVGTTAAVTLREKLRRGGFDPDALAHARQTTLAALETFRAPLPDIEADVRAEYEQLRARGALPENTSEPLVLDSIRRTQLARHYSIPPGESRAWTFDLPPGRNRAPPPLFLQFRCDASIPGAADIPATLQLEAGDTRRTRPASVIPGAIQTLRFDPLPSGTPRATVTFANPGGHDATLFFDPADGLVLRRARGTFAGNYLRALAQLYLRLALFAAIGTTLGTLFSLPVATFLTLVLLLILQLSGFVASAAQADRETFVANVALFGADRHTHGHAHDLPAPSLAARAAAHAFYYTYRGTYLVLRPLLEHHALDDLAAARHIPPRTLLRDLLQQGLLLPLALALLSTAVLRRREWALPSLS